MSSKAKLSGLAKKPTRAASGPNPEAPANRTASPAPPETTPAAAPVPTSPETALAFFVGQNLLTSKKDPITAGTFVRLLEALAKLPNLPPISLAHISALAVIAPSALSLSSLIFSSVSETRMKVDKLIDANKKILELVENPVGLDEDIGEKIVSMMSLVEKATSSAEAAEKAAEESHKSFITLIDTQGSKQGEGWNKVTSQNSRTHRDRPPPPHTKATETQSSKPSVQSKPGPRLQERKLDEKSAQRARVQASTILVQPKTVTDEDMDKLPAKALVTRAEKAWSATWDALKSSNFAKNRGLTKMPRIKFRAARRLPSGGILYDLENRDQAALLSNACVARTFEGEFGNATCLGQHAEILLESAPISFDPANQESIRALEAENQIEPGSVVSCVWVKRVRRWHPRQTRAVLKLSMRLQDVADSLIASQGVLECQPVRFRRIELEPIRCLKCQKYGHRANTCKAEKDACSQCGEDHRSADCTNRDKTFCISCKSEDHTSWNRVCPVFKTQREKLNERMPENRRKYFGPSRVDAQIMDDSDRGFIDLTDQEDDLLTPGQWSLGDTLGEDGQMKASTIPGYFGQRPAWSQRGETERKEREGSEPWDVESVVTPPKRAYTPSSPPPISRTVLDNQFDLLSLDTSDQFRLRPVNSCSCALSVSSDSSDGTVTPSRSPPHRALPVSSRPSALL